MNPDARPRYLTTSRFKLALDCPTKLFYPGKINLYVGKTAVKFNIPESEAVERLVDLIREHGKWVEPAAAEPVVKSLVDVGEVRKPKVQQAGFVVLKSPDIPSMLVETAYISNQADERKLRQPAHRARIANAIFDGIQDYFSDNAPDGTRLAMARRATVAAVDKPARAR